MIDYIERVTRAGAEGDANRMLAYIELLVRFGPELRYPRTRQIDSDAGIWELRPRPHRIAYIEHDGLYVLLHAWRKQAQRLDPRAARQARARAAEWRASQ